MNSGNQNVALLHKVVDDWMSAGSDADRSTSWQDYRAIYHPDIVFNGCEIAGRDRTGKGRDRFMDMIEQDAKVVAEGSRDEVLAIHALGESLAVIHGRAHRRFRRTGEAVSYNYATLVRIDDGLITRMDDMIDAIAEPYWQRAWDAFNMAAAT